jgi:hypothetical protein
VFSSCSCFQGVQQKLLLLLLHSSAALPDLPAVGAMGCCCPPPRLSPMRVITFLALSLLAVNRCNMRAAG